MSPPCAICGGSGTNVRHEWLFRCPSCGFLWSTLEPAVQERARKERIDEERRETALEALRRENFRRILDLVGKHQGEGTRSLLDVGCAHGWFAAMAAERGMNAFGLEPDEEMAAIAKRNGVAVRVGFFPDMLAPDEQFDVISFNDVFEHLPDVAGMMTACSRHLRDGGLLVVNLPNAEGFFYRTADFLDRVGVAGPFERMWQKNFASPHLSYFTPDLLARLARQHGLQEVVRQPLETIELHGLWSRLRYDRGAGMPVSAAIWAGVAASVPLLRFAPPDINVQLFRRAGTADQR